MKIWATLPAVLLALSTVCARADLNRSAQDVLRMSQSGVDENVIDSYINSSQRPYHLAADDIIFLQNEGVPQSVISAMISHDNYMAQGQSPGYQQPVAPGDQQYSTSPPDQQQYVSDQSDVQENPPIVNVPPDQAPSAVASFYDVLSPYGNWIYLEGHGWCWQPNTVRTDPGWRPYCDNGNWLYSDDGWYWQSSYSWGWAPFHYGRWWQASCGWVWFPDTVWAPSWVCWRDYDNFCGWAPLPPSGFVGYGRPGFHFGVNVGLDIGAGLFTFVHFGDMFHPHLRDYAVPRTQVTQIFNRTTVINNVTVVNNNFARNPGIPRTRVERFAGPVRVAHVQTSTADPRHSRPGVVSRGSQLAIVRPQAPPAPVRNTPIVAHRLPATARTVPATPPQQVLRTHRQAGHTAPAPTTPRNAVQNPTRPGIAPTTQPRTTLHTPRTTTPTPGATTPRVTETPHGTTPRVTETPRTNPHVTETPHPTNPRVTETPRPTNPRVTETPRPTNPRATETPRFTNPRVTETPHPTTPRAAEVPRPTPHVTEVPHPAPTAPHVTQVPRATPPPQTWHSYPTPAAPAPQTPRVEAPRAIHEPAGAQAPVVVPRAQPAPHIAVPPPQPHISAPPPARPFSAPGIERRNSPPPGLERRPQSAAPAWGDHRRG